MYNRSFLDLKATNIINYLSSRSSLVICLSVCVYSVTSEKFLALKKESKPYIASDDSAFLTYQLTWCSLKFKEHAFN